MQKHKKEMMENAIFMGIVALLIVSLVTLMGHDMTANAIKEGKPVNETGRAYWTFASIISISAFLFIALTLRTFLPEKKVIKVEEELKEFIHQCGHRGYVKEEIVALLSGHGWSKQEIEEYF
jgi:hypothetical protein